jgi:serine protease Do
VFCLLTLGGVRTFLVALALFSGGCGASTAPSQASSSANAADAKTTGAEERSLSPAQIAAASTPAIVSIRTPVGLGTGFLVRSDGWVVTNLHVIADANEAIVTLANKKSYPVLDVVSASVEHDLALLRIELTGSPVLKLGNSEAVRAGDSVVAIGHPLGLEDTVSNGLVSAVREVGDLTALQISAPIAPGSSGGPLFNDRGEVIGVATAILRGGQNLNLGMPAKYVQQLMQSPTPVSLADFAAARAQIRSEPKLPRIKREVPQHALTIWNGCDDAALAIIGHGISEAIDVGAPLYNDGNFAACYHIYEGAAADMQQRLPKQCQGPKLALSQGRAKASKLSDPSAQAWAMRDAFDGLTDALMRELQKKHGAGQL